jgi:SAM-dependent methyltransferase
MQTEPYVNKTVPFKFNGAELRLDLSHALFSSFDVDRGTKLLLKAAARDPVLARARRVLDEGCGVGVIGLSVAKAFPEAELLLRDRDSLAVAFAERNRLSNRLKGRTAWKDPATGEERTALPAPRSSWGLMGAGSPIGSFDFVFSNLPAKAGGPVLEAFFSSLTGRGGGVPLLAEGGRAAVVIVEPLAASAEEWIGKAGLSIASRSRSADHVAFVLEEGPAPGRAAEAAAAGAPAAADQLGAAPASPDAPLADLGLRAYLRSENRFRLAGVAYRAKGFWGLPEFDTPGFAVAAAAELASRVAAGCLVRDALVIDPGVGHFALWASRVLGPDRVTAASRDLLALAAAGANLADLPQASRPAYRAVDELGLDLVPDASFDLIADFSAVVPELDGAAPAWARAGRLLKRGGVFIAARSLTEMSRLERRRPSGAGATGPEGSSAPAWTALGRKRKKGLVAEAWRRA